MGQYNRNYTLNAPIPSFSSPTKYELVIHLQTAKALSLTTPPGMFAIADEEIE